MKKFGSFSRKAVKTAIAEKAEQLLKLPAPVLVKFIQFIKDFEIPKTWEEKLEYDNWDTLSKFFDVNVEYYEANAERGASWVFYLYKYEDLAKSPLDICGVEVWCDR